MAKILLVTSDGAESLEVMYRYQRLTEEGYQVDIAVPSRKTLHLVVPSSLTGRPIRRSRAIDFSLISRSLRSSPTIMLAW
jgi:putative intracellular protease/amidase